MAPPPQPHESLYKTALLKFRRSAEERYRDSQDRTILDSFLHENATPQDAKLAAESLAADSKKKYSSKNLKVGDVEIPQSWIDNILGNINNFVAAGDKLTAGAPESVAMAWWAISKSLGAIQANYELYSLFGTGLSDISEIMVLVRHYDRLYDEQSKPGWKPSDLVEKLFQDIIAAYVGVLDFSLAIRRHLSAGTLARLRHGIKDFYGGNKGKFESKLAVIAKLKVKILEESQAAFQDKTLTQLEGVSAVLSDIAGTVQGIKDLQKEQEKWHQQSMAMQTALLASFEEIKAITKPRTRWDHALQHYQKTQGVLNAIPSSAAALSAAIDARHPGTCEWILEAEEYISWGSSSDSALLSIAGQEGTGKSVMIASIVERLGSGTTTDKSLLYLSCGTSMATEEGRQVVYTADTICNTFLSNIYKFAAEDANNPTLLEACNEVFANPKSRKGKAIGSLKTTKAEDDLPDFADAFSRIAAQLKKNIVLVLDGIDKSSVKEADQAELYQRLGDLAKAEAPKKDAGVCIQILVGCSNAVPAYPHLDLTTRNSDDIEKALGAALEDIEGLSAAEQEEAKTVVLKKTGFRFDYLVESAIPFLREPFQRPLSKRLEQLPEGINDTYVTELQKMSPNYRELLETTLTWSLLETQGRPLHVREIMDVFHGVYDRPPPEGEEAEVKAEFPLASRLEIEQLRRAGGPFFSVRDGGDKAVVEIPDRIRVADFCLDKAPESHEDSHDEDQLCIRCKGLRSSSNNLSISSKQGHLQIALSCLRHLNNPIFQRRANLTEKRPDEAIHPPKPAAVADAENEGEDHAESDGYKTDDSWDDEDWRFADDDDDSSSQEDDDVDYLYDEKKLQWIRYEMQFWPVHLREAEARWSEEEREGDETWAAVMAELDKLSAQTLVFENWQKTFYERRNWVAMWRGRYKPLHVAAYFGLTSWTKHLLDRGEDVKAQCLGFTPIQVAAGEHRNLRVVELLVAAGADLNAKTKWSNPAQYAWYWKQINLEVVRLFLSLGADPTTTSFTEDWTALHYLGAYGTDDKVLDLLLEKGADINARDSYQQTPLHLLLWRSHVPLRLVEAFVKAGADVNAEDDNSIRPLQMASEVGELEVLRLLAAADVSEIDDEDHRGNTALNGAVEYGRADCARFLLESGASATVTNNYGGTALHLAAQFGHAECVEILLEHAKKADVGVDVNLADQHNRTPFFQACNSRNQTAAILLLDALLERGLPLSEISKTSIHGRTPLRQAASHGFGEVVSRLIKLSVETSGDTSLGINKQDERKGQTPLHRAALGGHIECVRQLLDVAETNSTLRDTKGRTPLGVAAGQWAIASTNAVYEDIVSLLIARDPDVAREDSELVAVSAANGSLKILRQLFNLNALLNRTDRYEWTPLQLALSAGPRAAAAAEFLRRQTAWAGLLPSRWGTEYPCATVGTLASKSVAKDGTTISFVVDREDVSIAANRPLPPGLEQYYFEVTIGRLDGGHEQEKHPEVAVGFCTIGGGVLDFPGWLPNAKAPEAKSWAYHGDDGGVYRSSGTGDADERMQPFEVGDTIGCGVDLSKREISWTRNGVKLGATVKDVEGRLFPVIGLHANVKIETNFGTAPFKWPAAGEIDGVMAEGGMTEGGMAEGGVDAIVDGVQELKVSSA